LIAPTLLTAGLIAHSNRSSSQWSQVRNLISTSFAFLGDPLIHANVASMEESPESKNDEHVDDTETRNDKGEVGREGQPDAEPPTTETPTKEQTPNEAGDNAKDGSSISEDEMRKTNEIGGPAENQEEENQQEDCAAANDNLIPAPSDLDGEEDDDDDKEDGEEDEDDDDDGPSPPAPLYDPVKGAPDELSKEDLWDNFTIKAVRMTDDEFDDEGMHIKDFFCPCICQYPTSHIPHFTLSNIL